MKAVLINSLAVATLTLAPLSWSGAAQGAERPPARRPEIIQGNLRKGEPAPDFTLQDVSGGKPVTLSTLRGKPVVLIFGSCTCPPFVGTSKATGELYDAYKEKAHFNMIYMREAHPTDGWAIGNNQFKVATPKSLEERQKIARDFVEKLGISMPLLVDGIDDRVGTTYAGWPNRMVILDAKGNIADPGTAGPGGVSSSLRRARGVLDELLPGGN